MSKKGQKYKRYSAEFKTAVILDMREHQMGYRETARKYELVRHSESSAAAMVQRWERIYLEEGAEGLMKERRGRAKALMEEELANVNNYLRIQQYRFRNKINITETIDPAAKKCCVPKLLIQPIVENAVFYGLEPKTGERNLNRSIPSVDKDTQGFRSQTARHNCVVLI